MALQRAMNARPTHAGGFFLVLATLGGFAWGAMSGTPMFGALVGTGIGMVVALAVWMVDRRRG